MVEKEIFGCKVIVINDEIAMEFINFENPDPTPTEFQAQFNKKVEHNGMELVFLQSSNELIDISSFGMRLIDHYVLIVSYLSKYLISCLFI